MEPDEAEEAEEYEQVPRQKLNEKERQRDRAAPLPLKVRGQLVYPDAKESAAAPEHAPVHPLLLLSAHRLRVETPNQGNLGLHLDDFWHDLSNLDRATSTATWRLQE